MPATKRGEYLFKAAELLAKKLPQLGEEMTREEGKTLPEAIGEVTRAINIFRYFGGEGARQFTYNVPSERPQVLCYTIRKPLGTVALITPWNFPSAIPAWKLAPALVAGNTVVLKPASLAPLSAFRLSKHCTKRRFRKASLTTSPEAAARSAMRSRVIRRSMVHLVHGLDFGWRCVVSQSFRSKTARTTRDGWEEPDHRSARFGSELRGRHSHQRRVLFYRTECTACSRAIIERRFTSRWSNY